MTNCETLAKAGSWWQAIYIVWNRRQAEIVERRGNPEGPGISISGLRRFRVTIAIKREAQIRTRPLTGQRVEFAVVERSDRIVASDTHHDTGVA